MPPCRTCNNLTAEDLLAGTSSYWPLSTTAFTFANQAGELENSAASGCATCNLIFQAIRRYIETAGFEPFRSDPKLDKSELIHITGHYNEPLSVLFSKESFCTYIEIYEERDHFEKEHASLYPAVGLGSTPPEVLDIDFAARLASQWISRCDNEHTCVGGNVRLPSRVLDVTSDSVKLVIPTASTTGYYAALSYCWGSAGNLTTTSDNLDRRKAGIVWNSLPNLIQDAIEMTRGLGLPYLWVDALCIIQDDKDDWRAESSKMGDIYAGAYLTIAADAATDTSCRLTNPRKSILHLTKNDDTSPSKTSAGMRDKKIIEVFPPLVVDGRTHSLCVREPWQHRDIIRNSALDDLTFPLSTRGWALQERLFASRVLHFAAYEMIWECKTSLNCECKGILQQPLCQYGFEHPKASFETAKVKVSMGRMTMSSPSWAASGDMLQQRDFFAVWTQLVSAYTARHLTVETDRLPAMSALAKHLSQGGVYLAGLWANDLPWHLVWCCDYVNDWRRVPKSTTVYSGPSWSWASTTEQVSWPSWTHEARSQIQILEASTAPMSLNEFGEVFWGWIRLKARVDVARVAFSEEGSFQPSQIINSHGFPFYAYPDVVRGEKKPGSDQRTWYNLAACEDVWCLLLLDHVAEHGHGRPDRSLWIMVAAKPNANSMRRAGLDPDGLKDIIICERIGYMRPFQDSLWAAREWIDGPDFKEKELILI